MRSYDDWKTTPPDDDCRCNGDACDGCGAPCLCCCECSEPAEPVLAEDYESEVA